MKDGSVSRVVVMNKAEVAKHMRESKGWDKPTSPWKRWTSAMWLKTATHELEKWVPSSTEYMRERLRAAQEVAAEKQGQVAQIASVPAAAAQPHPVAAAVTDDVVEAEFVDDEPAGWPQTANVPQ
jgi:recombination protein RecT